MREMEQFIIGRIKQIQLLRSEPMNARYYIWCILLDHLIAASQRLVSQGIYSASWYEIKIMKVIEFIRILIISLVNT